MDCKPKDGCRREMLQQKLKQESTKQSEQFLKILQLHVLENNFIIYNIELKPTKL